MEKLPVMIVIILMIHALCVGVESQSRCEPAELGQSHTLQCNIPGSGLTGGVIWYTEEAFQCGCSYKSLVCPDCQNTDYSATLSTTQNGYLSTITVNNIQKNPDGGMKNWTCVDGGTTTLISSCTFDVFASPTSVTCEVQTPSSTSDPNVTVRCDTPDEVYPHTACLFHRITNQSTSTVGPGTGVTIQPEDKQCTLVVAGTYLGPGDHQFGVVMYPNVTGDQTDEKYGKMSPNTTSINIGYPTAELRDCPTQVGGGSMGTDYIKEGTTGHTCRCTRTDKTFFPVDISWKYNNGGIVPGVTQQNQSATLPFNAIKDQAFTCTLSNSLLWTKNVIYTPQVAYGPKNVDIPVNPPSQDLCQASKSFTVQCQVSASDVVPSATFSYTVNTTTSSVVPSDPASGSTSTATVTVTEGGVHGITCLANNSIFPGIRAEKSVSVVVKAPPSSPILEIFMPNRVSPTNGDILRVEEGILFNVTCHVIGGYPEVTRFNLSCGEDQTVTITNNQAQKTVSFTRKMNGQPCSCVATHDSSCYTNNAVSYMLDVQYPPAVTSYSVTNIGNGEVENGTTLTFNCEAEGNPGPGLSLQHDGRGDVTSVPSSNTTETRLRHNLTMDCLNTGVYTCTAQAQGRENSSKVEVFVLCPQQLESSQSQNTVYDRKINSTFDINVTVYGYPKPTLPLQLHGHKEDLLQDDYNITYTETRPPLGNVTLTFYSLTEKYFQNYTLNVTNSKGSLVYNFTISGYVASPSKDSDDLNAAAIGGGIAAAVVVILIIVLVVFIVRKKVNPCARKGDSSRKAGQDEEHVIPNDLYSGANSGEVVIDNSDLYSGNWNRKSNEVVIDNSDLYSGFSKPGSKEVVVDNSALYGKSDDFKETREALYKNYTDVTPSMTSATAVPVDMKASNGAKQGGNSSYEDVEVGAKSPGPSVQPKPKVAVKPMTAAKPTPAPKPGGPSTSGPQGAIVLQDDGVNQMYASVVRPVKPQAPKPQPTNQRESDYFPDQSKKPEVPEKKYEQEESLTGQEGKKKEQKSGGDKKKKNKKADEIPMVPKGGAAASTSHDNPYVNGGFAEDDGNVYANATGNKSRKD